VSSTGLGGKGIRKRTGLAATPKNKDIASREETISCKACSDRYAGGGNECNKGEGDDLEY